MTLRPTDDPRAANAPALPDRHSGHRNSGGDVRVGRLPGDRRGGRDEQEWLKTFLRLPHGIPSVSTFRRVFAAAQAGGGAVEGHAAQGGELGGLLAGKQIAIDGKTLRRSFDHGWDKSGLHLVTAWCVEENLVLAQQAVDQKSNEITAVPLLLNMLDIRGGRDGGCAQHADGDAAQVVKGGGDYVMAVKDNHPTLCDALQRNLDEMILENFAGVEHVYHETTESGHGRIDTRRVWATGQIDWLGRRDQWKKLTSVIVVEATRRLLGENKVETSRRYYISSLPCQSGQRFATLIRNHWSIENAQHWSLDVAFNEDQSRVRKDHGDQAAVCVESQWDCSGGTRA